MLCTDEIEAAAYDAGFLFSTTHVSDPLPAAVGLKVIEVVVRERLAERALMAGSHLGVEILAQALHDVAG